MRLSPRQTEVAKLLATEGLDYAAIASRIGLTPATVQQYVIRASKRLPGPGSPRQKLLAWWYSRHREKRQGS